jgi:spermidine synthase
MRTPEDGEGVSRGGAIMLLIAVTVAASCAIVYELIIATISSYLLGNSVYHFSITIGVFMVSMGLGSFLSRYLKTRLVERFILVEVSLGLIGGASAVALYAMYVAANSDAVYSWSMFSVIVVIGTLVGLEIPLLTRILNERGGLRIALANALTFDYAGALVGSVAFPLIMLKYVGLVRTAFVMGLLNVAAGAIILPQADGGRGRRWSLTAVSAVAATLLVLGVKYEPAITAGLERALYDNPIITSQQSPYQKLTITRRAETWPEADAPGHEPRVVAKRGNDLRLFIDGQIQFSSVDEYRYHEALVHPAMSAARSRASVLILGGGDGLAARDVLRYPDVVQITLVDLDPRIIELCSTHPEIAVLNEGSLNNPRVRVINQDGYKFVEQSGHKFDVVIIDLPDPNHETLSKLYSVEFYRLVARALYPGGAVVTQSTSPFFARAAFWSIHRTMEAAGLHVLAYHTNVPSLGDWGFNLATDEPVDSATLEVRVETLFLTAEQMPAMFRFGKDATEVEAHVNTLLRPVLMHYYDDDRWGYY